MTFDRLALALFEQMGLDPPFDDMLSPHERLYAKHHGERGDCLRPDKCHACARTASDIANYEAGRDVGMTAQEDADLRAKRATSTPLAQLPRGMDPRSTAAFEHMQIELATFRSAAERCSVDSQK